MIKRVVLAFALVAAIGSETVAAQRGPTQAELNAAAENASDWLYATHDYSGRRFVRADQITPQNAGDLQVVCMEQVGENSPFLTNPVVYNGVLYLTSKLVTAAIDATTCRVKWRHEWTPKSDEGWPQSRGVAIKDGLAVRVSTDGYLYALDLETGELIWDRKLADIEQHEGGFTMPPLIFEDLIIAGPAGSELGVKGWIGAFRLQDGEPVWRFNTVPEPDEPGAETWENPESRLLGGGAVWTPITLDPETGHIYVPAANPATDFYGDIRPGDNLYTSTMIVLDVRTGERVWHYQVVPHDVHDWDLTHAGPLFEAQVGGANRKLVATGGERRHSSRPGPRES
jgi:alcohol dehydrogenase (cytochrome c)